MIVDVEKAVLGSMLWNKECQEKGFRLLKADDFLKRENSLLFTAMRNLKEKNLSVDLVLVADEISYIEGITNKDAFIDYLEGVVKTESISAHFESYVLKMLEKSKRYKLKSLGTLLQDHSGDSNKAVQNIVSDVASRIAEIGMADPEVSNVDEYSSVKDLQVGEGDYVKTGFSGIDELIYGFSKGELVILAARPSVGKTALALNIARNVSENDGVIFYSLEMSKKDIGLRLVASECEINMNRIKHAVIDKTELQEVEKAFDVVKKLNIHIDDTSNLSLADIIGLSTRINSSKSVGFIVVDYLTLIKTSGNDKRYLQIGEITRGLKRLAKEMNVPVLLLAQLGRAVEARELQKPRLSDLRESGDIEQDADKVIFLYQPDKEAEDIEIQVMKNRNGSVGLVVMKFIKQFVKFRDW
jgi:replicative DNA helicase